MTDLRDAFRKFDKNGDGLLSLEELKEGIRSFKNIKISEFEIEKTAIALDSNKNGFVDYTEFIAACIETFDYLEEH